MAAAAQDIIATSADQTFVGAGAAQCVVAATADCGRPAIEIAAKKTPSLRRSCRRLCRGNWPR